ncbi:MAG TPA: hypothetical protein DCM05_11085 [Elusimicrobia bacterium]|nr:hypothetical protein [Elusimicrobiota bacterium]
MNILFSAFLAVPIAVSTGTATLSCSDAQALRDFKDIVYGKLNPSRSPDVATDWAACLCGKAAYEAGTNARPPAKTMDALPAMDAYFVEQHKKSLKKWKAWFKKHLPVDDKQAELLSLCTCRDVQLCAPQLEKKGKKKLAEPAPK